MCHLPMNAVRQPARWRCSGKNVVPGGMGDVLSTTPCRCAYCPVRIDARLGEHSDVVTNALRTCAPSAAIRSSAGVSSHSGAPGMKPMKS